MIVKAPIAMAVIAHALFAEARILLHFRPMSTAAAPAASAPARDAPRAFAARDVRSLRGLLPFLRPYRARIAAGGAVPGARRGHHAGLPGGAAVADRPGLRDRRPGRARDGAARALLRAVRGRRRARRVLGGALLHGELARRARHRRPAQRGLRARRAAEPGVLRDDADRRGAVAPDDRHHAGADRRRLEPVDGPAQRRDGHRRAWRC